MKVYPFIRKPLFFCTLYPLGLIYFLQNPPFCLQRRRGAGFLLSFSKICFLKTYAETLRTMVFTNTFRSSNKTPLEIVLLNFSLLAVKISYNLYITN